MNTRNILRLLLAALIGYGGYMLTRSPQSTAHFFFRYYIPPTSDSIAALLRSDSTTPGPACRQALLEWESARYAQALVNFDSCAALSPQAAGIRRAQLHAALMAKSRQAAQAPLQSLVAHPDSAISAEAKWLRVIYHILYNDRDSARAAIAGLPPAYAERGAALEADLR